MKVLLDEPRLRPDVAGDPPLIRGTASLAARAFQGWTRDRLLADLGPEPAGLARAAWLLDRALTHALTFDPAEAAALQAQALSIHQVFRVAGAPTGAIRLLALMAPGNLMVNAPLDFLTAAAGIDLTLAFAAEDGTLPPALPAHDAAIVAISELHPTALAALPAQLANWPAPVLNDPARIALMSRDWLADALMGAPGITIAPTIRAARTTLRRQPVELLLPGGAYPVLLRPLHSHAGAALTKLDDPDDMAMALLTLDGDRFYLTQFIDYRGPDGWFRKYRIAFVQGAPYLCHMAASEHWMVHYLNAGMAESPAKRSAEAAAMAAFDTGFATRHRAAFATICATIGLDFFSIDCSEAADGSLLVFEADVAAIIHAMDDPALYPYKAPAMKRCFDGFATMIHRHASQHRGT